MFGKSRAKLSRSKSEALAGQCPEREDATKGSRLAAVQGTRFFPPEIPLAAVLEIPSPNRSPTKLGVGRAGKTVRPHCYNSLLCAHAAVPLRAARRTRGGKKVDSPLLSARRETPSPLMDLGRTKSAAAVALLEATSRPTGLPFSAPATPWFRELWVNASK